MRKSLFALAVIAAAIAAPAAQAQTKQIKNVGITLGSMGNPFFVSLAKGAEAKVKQLNPAAKVTALSADYDLNKQFSQIDGFISAGVDLILVNAVDAKAIEPALNKAKKAGIAVVGVDVAANGADATVQTNNVQAGEIACQFIVEKLGGKGNVIIQNGPQVSAVIDRVNGCKSVFKKNPDIKVLSDDQDAKGSREGGLNVMQNHLTRFPKIDAVFTINDPQAIGTDLAARQLNRKNIVIASVDGAPDIEGALKADTQVQASASQDPFMIAQKAVEIGQGLLNGQKPAQPMVLLPSTLVTRANVKDYKGWSAPR
ncbi:ABC transporter substrate-binding protein [Variovorax ginsengisoli]|uniref:Ribose transport system substrate-binding protein n=1 Tax=Variovorax ginsengisoli TaxID=363844 RepID=A0ABT9SDC0_9BURK|nr:ABC transporter substrate-binding protein [Variovorax ginsengisoli]MDP9901397.1 ribose transport system substrate-binding protein [Variovorax ginsengisoli]